MLLAMVLWAYAVKAYAVSGQTAHLLAALTALSSDSRIGRCSSADASDAHGCACKQIAIRC